MAKVKLSAPVRIGKLDEVTTIAALADAGRVTFTKTDKWSKERGRGYRIAYFAELIPEKNGGVTGCWEISEAAYKSRTGEEVTFEKPKTEPKERHSFRLPDPGTPWMNGGHK